MLGFLKLLFVIIIVAIGLAFHINNDSPVTLDYYLGTVEISLSVVVITSVLIGAILGLVASLSIIIPLLREKAKLNKAVKTAEKEVSNLRSIPLKDAD